MQISLFNRPTAPTNLPNMRGSFSEISQSEGTISKVVALVKAILLLPINFIKDVAHHVARPFKKAAAPTFKDRLIVALNIAKENVKEAAERTKEFVGENKKKIAKVSVATTAVALSYVAYRYAFRAPTPTGYSWATIIGGGATALGAVAGAYKYGVFGKIKSGVASKYSSCKRKICKNTPKLDPSKLDPSKLDPSKLDPSKLDPSTGTNPTGTNPDGDAHSGDEL